MSETEDALRDIALRGVNTPVDPDTYLFYNGVYCAAAHMTMPVENPAAKVIEVGEGQAFSFTDIPMNRGMLAATREMRQQGLADDVMQAIMVRLMHFGEVFGKEELKPFLKPSDEPGATMVSEALIKACATARFIIADDKMRFDIGDVARIAQQLTDAEDDPH